MTLGQAIHARFTEPLASELIAWLNAIDDLLRRSRGVVLLPYPSALVRQALGDDVVDELLDFIVATCALATTRLGAPRDAADILARVDAVRERVRGPALTDAEIGAAKRAGRP